MKIQQNKGKLIGNIAALVLFSVWGVFMVILDFDALGLGATLQPTGKMILFGIIKLSFAGSVLLFVSLIVKLAKKLRREILCVDGKGITYYDSIYPMGTILWKDVEHVYREPNAGSKRIVVDVKNKENYLRNIPQWRRKMLESGGKTGDLMIYISLADTDYTTEEVLKEIYRRKEAFDMRSAE